MAVFGKSAVTRHFRLPFRCYYSTRNIRPYSVLTTQASNYQNHYKQCFYGISTAQRHNNKFNFASQTRAMSALSPNDPSSFSRPELAVITHVAMVYDVDFEKKVLNSSALLTFEVLEDMTEVILDTSDLTIESIETGEGKPLKYLLGDPIPNFGSKLSIFLGKKVTKDQKFKIKIKYVTSPTATALQWLDPQQTSGKKHPYLFSQCQPIHARSILPCQDTPAVKFTYEAQVSAPEEFAILMSSIRDKKLPTKCFFRQAVPIPSYLLAIAVGVLEFRELGPRTKVWSEKEEIERSAYEFAEVEKYMQAAEMICGGYQWTQYDLLVLPPSFPYGGMENPCLTFVTPTLLAGDRSQADVLVHEIMHSWTGNMVTNKNFEHFWLNEGFTVFMERKVASRLIADPVEARRSRDFHFLLGLQELRETVYKHLGPSNPLTKLVPNLAGVHPDEAFSSIPYEKGALFFRYIEDKVGGDDVFEDFFRSYMNNYQNKSLDTAEFKEFMIDYFSDSDVLDDVDWNTWLYGNGMPPVIPNFDTSMSKAVAMLVKKIVTKDAVPSYDDVRTFTPHQMMNFLQELLERDPLPLEKVRALGDAYKLTSNKNSEIVYRWLRVCIRSKDETKLANVFDFVNSQGRMKYVRPIYRDLYMWEDMREKSIENFLKNEPNMMHVSAYTIRKDLHLRE